ncbi:MAG: segregation/condensation protein A, partial [Ruminococcus sp.]
KPVISVSSKIITVMRKLWHGKHIRYNELFTAVNQRSELVATFLAVLELVKGKRVRIDGDGDDAQVYMLDDRK